MGRPTNRALALRMVPIIGAGIFIVVALNYSLWWEPAVHNFGQWWVPGDCWTTYFASSAVLHGHLGSIYGARNGFISLPAFPVVLAPAVAIGQALHLPIGLPFTAVTTPTMWLLFEPYDLLAGCLALFSVDAVARRFGISRNRRFVLTAVEFVALWSPLVYQWHPEDVFSFALGMWGLLAVLDGRWRKAGWLIGVGIAFQPLLLLALVPLAALAPRRQVIGLIVRSGIPGALLLAGPLIASFRVTLRSIVEQPNSVSLNQATPWLHFAPRLADGMVASGPARLVAVVAAAVMSWVVCRRAPRMEVCVWTMAACFASRSLFEPVTVCYYIWPALALGLLIASHASRARFTFACVVASIATVVSIHRFSGERTSWSILAACIVALLAASWPQAERHEDQAHRGRLQHDDVGTQFRDDGTTIARLDISVPVSAG